MASYHMEHSVIAARVRTRANLRVFAFRICLRALQITVSHAPAKEDATKRNWSLKKFGILIIQCEKILINPYDPWTFCGIIHLIIQQTFLYHFQYIERGFAEGICINSYPAPVGIITFKTQQACCENAYAGQSSGACYATLPDSILESLPVLWYPEYCESFLIHVVALVCVSSTMSSHSSWNNACGAIAPIPQPWGGSKVFVKAVSISWFQMGSYLITLS